MRKISSERLTNFWFSFALGTTSGILISFLFGTKRGRKFLLQLLDATENIEEKLAHILDTGSDKKGAQTSPPSFEKTVSGGLDHLIEKIKVSLHHFS